MPVPMTVLSPRATLKAFFMRERIIPRNRTLSQMSSAKLRRARRLYIQLIAKTCAKSKNMIFIFAQRAQSRGLYSSKSGLRDICFSILSHLNKIAVSHKFKGDWNTFYDYYNNAGLITTFFRKNRGRRPTLRVVAPWSKQGSKA